MCNMYNMCNVCCMLSYLDLTMSIIYIYCWSFLVLLLALAIKLLQQQSLMAVYDPRNISRNNSLETDWEWGTVLDSYQVAELRCYLDWIYYNTPSSFSQSVDADILFKHLK